MDLTRAASPPTLSSQHFNLPHRSTTKALEMPSASTRAPMTIPNSRGEPPPPPLPPPTYMDDIAAGSDLGWAWENQRAARAMGGQTRGSIRSDSSMPQAWRIKQEREDAFERPAYERRGSSQATIKPIPEVQPKYDFSRHHDEGYYSLSGASSANHQSVSALFSLHRMRSFVRAEKWGWAGFGAGEMLMPTEPPVSLSIPWRSANVYGC